MIAIVAALFLLSIAVYQAWIRKVAVVAGVLVPAVIMMLYAAWVVILTKRDKRKQRKLFVSSNNQFSYSEMNYSLSLSLKMLESEALNDVLTTSPSCSSFTSTVTNNAITSTKMNAKLLSNTAANATRGKNLKQKRKCRRKKRRERLEKRRQSFIRVKKELLTAHTNIEMPEFTLSSKPWMRSYTIA